MHPSRHPHAQKLYEAIRKIAAPDLAEKIAFGKELPGEPSLAQKAAWVAHINLELEKRFTEEEIKTIRCTCYCREQLDACKKWIGELYRDSKGMEEFVEKMNARGADWYLQDGDLYTVYTSCSCALLEGTKTLPQKTWCHCTMGYGGELFGDIFGYPVEISVLETIKMGYPKCVIKVSGKIGTEP